MCIFALRSCMNIYVLSNIVCNIIVRASTYTLGITICITCLKLCNNITTSNYNHIIMGLLLLHYNTRNHINACSLSLYNNTQHKCNPGNIV